MSRVSFFIDGFNLYHGIKAYAPDCRWLNLRKLCESLINPNIGETVSDIFYFSAVATWLQEQQKVEKHKKYIRRLEEEGIKIVHGKFKEKDVRCKLCGGRFKSHEEKQTDVNIALRIIEEGVLDSYDKAVLISGDTDMIPAIITLKRLFGDKRIGVVFPIGRATKEFDIYADFTKKLTREILKDSLFERETSPEGWVPNISITGKE